MFLDSCLPSSLPLVKFCHVYEQAGMFAYLEWLCTWEQKRKLKYESIPVSLVFYRGLIVEYLNLGWTYDLVADV